MIFRMGSGLLGSMLVFGQVPSAQSQKGFWVVYPPATGRDHRMLVMFQVKSKPSFQAWVSFCVNIDGFHWQIRLIPYLPVQFVCSERTPVTIATSFGCLGALLVPGAEGAGKGIAEKFGPGGRASFVQEGDSGCRHALEDGRPWFKRPFLVGPSAYGAGSGCAKPKSRPIVSCEDGSSWRQGKEAKPNSSSLATPRDARSPK